MLAIEAGIDHQLDLENLSKSGTFQISENFEKINPLLKIPALETAEDGVIIDSPLICLYLNNLSKKRSLYSEDFKTRLNQMKLEAVADGLLDAAILRRYESLRNPQQQSHEFDQKQKLKIKNSMDFFESETQKFQTPCSIGELAILSSLAYLQFRFSQESWLQNYKKLNFWFNETQNFPAFKQTQFE